MSQQPQQVSVDGLNTSELADVRSQLEEELNHLTNSFAKTQAGKTILVPLTNSLYAPGKSSGLHHVIVDVGTGYFVQKVGSVLFMWDCSQRVTGPENKHTNTMPPRSSTSRGTSTRWRRR
ncbi:hypothetical protein B0H16DRAFT_1517794 [Mycena metata]|uniref:Prefoldin subunit 5 n=1 Tax=Mycena metata TaxID=1033252 RepID=A0AAD7NNY6_9AGAR|nr:hypothetical protein B0H16DRAFT_1517794 [Mycena metata]